VPVAWGQQTTCRAYTPWAEFHRPNMRRSNPCETVLNVNNVGSLSLKWSYQTNSFIDASPAVANGVVYVGPFDGSLYALNASTGALLWRYGAHLSDRSSPAVANGVVYVGSFLGVWALNASTGALLWRYGKAGTVDSSPAVANGVVYVGSDHQGPPDVYA
jgi:outer membrane protein assembly factor BamB